MSDKMQMNSLEMRGISDLLAFLEKWDEGKHGLYAKIVLSIPTQKNSDPDDDIGIVTFDNHGYYVFQGFNLDVRGIVKENYACKKCGTDVEIHRKVEELPLPSENFVTDNFGTTDSSWSIKSILGQPASGPYVNWDRTEYPDGVSPRMQEDLDTFKAAVYRGLNPEVANSTPVEDNKTITQEYRNVYMDNTDHIATDNPDGFGNHE